MPEAADASSEAPASTMVATLGDALPVIGSHFATIAAQAVVAQASSGAKAELPHNSLEDESGGRELAKKEERYRPLLKRASTHSWETVMQPVHEETTFSETIAPLAEKITEYIIGNQDDSAQEERWRTTIKRDMAKGFRVQREALDKQREATQKVETEMQRRFDDVQSKLDLIVESLATQTRD